jgi:hypothetical protein
MEIRVDPWSAPTCAPPNALRIRPHTPERVTRTSVGATFPSHEGMGPCPRHRIATRARICITGFKFYTYARGGLEDSAKIAKYSDEWYLSPPHRLGCKRKHSQVPIRRRRDRAHRERDAPHPPQRQGQGRRALPSFPRLAVHCLPPFRPSVHSQLAWRGLASTEATPEALRGHACVLSAGPTHRQSFRRRRG